MCKFGALRRDLDQRPIPYQVTLLKTLNMTNCIFLECEYFEL